MDPVAFGAGHPAAGAIFNASIMPPAAPPAPPQEPAALPGTAAAPADEWRTSGHSFVGRDLVRLVEGGPATASAKVVGWLDAHESDFLDDDGKPAALFHIKYTDGTLAGDEEDLEEHEVQGSLKIESDDEAIAAVAAALPTPSAAPLGPPAPAPAPPPPPDNHPGRLIDPKECPDTTEVKFIAANPKRAGTACHLRYEAYKDATTVKEFLAKGGWRADLVHDVKKNYAALGGAVPTGTPPPPTKPRAPRKPAKDDDEVDKDWENAEEPDDSEDEDFAPSLEMKRAAAAELGDAPPRKRPTRSKQDAIEDEKVIGESIAAVLEDEMPPAAPLEPAAEAPGDAEPVQAPLGIPMLGAPIA